MNNNSNQLLCPKKKKRAKSVFVKLPAEVKTARSFSKNTFKYWKQNSFPNEGDIHDEYRENRKAYRSLLCGFLNEIESDRSSKLCPATDSDEKVFWKLLKGRRCSSQMSAFLVDGKMITDKGGGGGEYVTCGQTILRHLVLPWRGWDLMIISAPESPTVLKKYFRSVLKIHQVCQPYFSRGVGIHPDSSFFPNLT